MIKEAYCSYEVAKLLKEKGFDEGCSFVVNTMSKGVMPVSWPTTNSDIENEKASLIALPTHQMAMAWLREKHIVIVIQPEYFNADSIVSYWGCDIWIDDNYERLQGDFTSYEEAIEAALKYCLKNL